MTRLITLSLCLFFMFLTVGTSAQTLQYPADTIAQRYDREILTYSGTWYFKKGGEKINLGFFAENLRKEVNDFESSKIIFEDALKARRTSLIFNMTGLGLLAAGAIVRSQEGSQDLQTGLFVSGIVSLSVSIPFSFRFNDRLYKSINEHNKRTILQPLRK